MKAFLRKCMLALARACVGLFLIYLFRFVCVLGFLFAIGQFPNRVVCCTGSTLLYDTGTVLALYLFYASIHQKQY